MTEYDYSEEAHRRHLQTQAGVASWVRNVSNSHVSSHSTSRHAQGEPLSFNGYPPGVAPSSITLVQRGPGYPPTNYVAAPTLASVPADTVEEAGDGTFDEQQAQAQSTALWSSHPQQQQQHQQQFVAFPPGGGLAPPPPTRRSRTTSEATHGNNNTRARFPPDVYSPAIPDGSLTPSLSRRPPTPYYPTNGLPAPNDPTALPAGFIPNPNQPLTPVRYKKKPSPLSIPHSNHAKVMSDPRVAGAMPVNGSTIAPTEYSSRHKQLKPSKSYNTLPSTRSRTMSHAMESRPAAAASTTHLHLPNNLVTHTFYNASNASMQAPPPVPQLPVQYQNYHAPQAAAPAVVVVAGKDHNVSVLNNGTNSNGVPVILVKNTRESSRRRTKSTTAANYNSRTFEAESSQGRIYEVQDAEPFVPASLPVSTKKRNLLSRLLK